MAQDTQQSRIVSLDQFRGYTVLGMFLVNFVGCYAAIKATLPTLCHHHNHFSYADSIMPQFFFAVGFAYRLTLLKRWESAGPRSAYWHAIKRNLSLILLGFVVHHLDGRYETWAKLEESGWSGFFHISFQRNFFQTLTHIGITSLWVMPVIASGPIRRISFALLSVIAFHLLSENGYYEWVMKRPGIDGGRLGFLTWTIPLIVGSLAYDAVVGRVKPPFLRLLAGGVFLMLLGYALSCFNRVAPTDGMLPMDDWKNLLVEPPFVPPARPDTVNIWTMSQRAGSVSYLTFGAGFSLAVYALFVLACDIGPLHIPLLRTLGTNALVGYVVHDLVNDAVKPFIPKDSPLWFIFIGFGISLLICYLFLRFLEKQRLYLKL